MLHVFTEFLEVGKKQPALDVLYDVIKSKKHRTWQKIHEPIMLKYLELCVDLRKSHLAKEGLYQYKNICQQVCEERAVVFAHITWWFIPEICSVKAQSLSLLSGEYQISGGCGEGLPEAGGGED